MIYFCFCCEENASNGTTTYVHCKAGRGRSTTIVICYLVSVRLGKSKTKYLMIANFLIFPSFIGPSQADDT